MTDTNIENQLRLDNRKLNRRIALLEEKLLEKEGAERALQDSEKRYRRLFESAKDGILILNADTGQVADVNPFLVQLLGYTYEEICNKRIWDIGSFRDIAASSDAFKTLQENEYIRYEDLPLQTRSGQRIDVEFVSNVYLVDGSKVIQCNIRDITERKRVQEELQFRNILLSTQQEASIDGILVVDEKARILSYNHRFVEMWGIPEKLLEDNVDEPVLQFVTAQVTDPESFNQRVQYLYDHRRETSRDEIILAEGRVFDRYSAPMFGPEERYYGRIWYFRDVTENKRVEVALHESEAKTRSILDNIGIGVSLISPKMEVLELNRRMREWFPAIDPGQHHLCYRAFNDPPREGVCDSCPTCETLQDGLVHEATVQTPQAGALRNYRIVTSPIFNAWGEVTAVIEMVEDITEKLTLESQYRQAQKMEAVGQLAGGVAHDFNNMLGVILGYSEMALDNVNPAQPLHADLLAILNAAKRATAITRQLLAFARKQTIDPKVLDLNETLEVMLKMLRRLIGEDIDLVWLPRSGLWPVNMDPTQVEQILANLCVNARDAIAKVGKITIETENAAIDETYCTNHAGFVPGEYVMLVVSDDGWGIGEEILDKIFEPFFTTKEVGRGTGLGLATVYGIVKQNNGFINVYSERGKGTTFKIYLPRQAGQAVDTHEEKTGELPPGRGETVLVVEDEISLLQLVSGILDSLGYTLLTAGTPGEAMRLAEEYTGEIHLLMTDVILPEMNGKDLAEQIKKTRPAMKCLFMSGYTADVVAHRGMLDEGVQFIPKPFSRRDLAAKIRTTLEKSD